MTIDRFMLDGFKDETIYQGLRYSSTFPLVRELEFNYGLKVFARGLPGHHYDGAGRAYVMADKHGLATCAVWTDSNGGREGGELRYLVESPFYLKARGLTLQDRRTVHAKNISSLMRTIRDKNVLRDEKLRMNSCIKVIEPMVKLVSDKQGRVDKPMYDLSAELVQAAFYKALGVTDIPAQYATIDYAECKKHLDNWEEADRVKEKQRTESMKVFSSPFYLVGADAYGHYLVGKFKLNDAQYVSPDEVVVIEPFKRYKSYKDVPDLVPTMTMLKLSLEDKVGSVNMAGELPVMDDYNSDLEIVHYYRTRPSWSDLTFMLTPCHM